MCLFENKTIPHDSSIDRFESASVPYDQQCKKEARVCRNGKVSGTYEYSHCQPETPLSCSFNGQEIKHNESIFVYTTDSVPFGSSCEGVKASLRCINGNMNSSAGSQKIFGTCQILPEVKPKDPCGEVVDEFIVRQVVTRHSGSYLPVMVTPLVQGESYCSDNLVEKIPENLKTVSYVEANTRFHICMYPALPKWYDDGRWVGANYFSSGGISFAITGPYKIVSKRDPKFLHGHESLNQFTRNRGLTFVQGKNENYNLNNLWVCLRPPPKPSSGGGGGRPDYNVNLQ